MTSHLWVLGFGRPSWVSGLKIYGIFGSAAWYALQFFCNMIPVEQKRKNGNRDQHNRDALSIFVARSVTAILVLYNHLFENVLKLQNKIISTVKAKKSRFRY